MLPFQIARIRLQRSAIFGPSVNPNEHDLKEWTTPDKSRSLSCLVNRELTLPAFHISWLKRRVRSVWLALLVLTFTGAPLCTHMTLFGCSTCVCDAIGR